jgi:hypothetical protein
MPDRYLDLLKQGFMKRPKEPKRKAAPKELVSCNKCQNWHYRGKHVCGFCGGGLGCQCGGQEARHA